MLIEKLLEFDQDHIMQAFDKSIENEKKLKKNQRAIRSATLIIEKSISNDIFNNIIDIIDLKKIKKNCQ